MTEQNERKNQSHEEPAQGGLPDNFFSRLTKQLQSQVDLECGRCAEPFRGDPEGDGLCSRCSHYASVPADAPGAFNWLQKNRDGTWTVRALWEDYRYVGDGRREDVPLTQPKPGDHVLVYRRDGTSSLQTIMEVGESYYGGNASRYLYCQVIPSGR